MENFGNKHNDQVPEDYSTEIWHKNLFLISCRWACSGLKLIPLFGLISIKSLSTQTHTDTQLPLFIFLFESFFSKAAARK